MFAVFARNISGRQVNQNEVVFRSARDEAQSAFDQTRCKRIGVFANLALIFLESGRKRFFEANGFSGDCVHERAALNAGHDRFINRFGVLRFTQNEA